MAGGTVRAFLFERLRWGEDFFPGTPPDVVLEPEAWTTTGDAIADITCLAPLFLWDAFVTELMTLG